MGWRYQAKRIKEDFGDGYEYTVVEAYPDLEILEGVTPHTEKITFYGYTPQDLAKWLRTAADDIEKYDVIICEDEDD